MCYRISGWGVRGWFANERKSGFFILGHVAHQVVLFQRFGGTGQRFGGWGNRTWCLFVCIGVRWCVSGGNAEDWHRV